MVVEHTFVTTMEPADAMRTAADMLSRYGFTAVNEVAFQVGDGEWKTLEVRRGMAKPHKSKGYQDLPQQIRVEWDRGRVEVAGMVQERPRYGSRSFGLTGVWWNSDFTGHAVEKNPIYEELLLAQSQALELLLCARQPEAAQARFDAIELRLAEETERFRRKRRRRQTIAWIFVIVVFALLGVVIYFSVSSR